ncbi:MAG TPA: nuclear transport factor 2 family protein [Acidimicrobiales bacterium]|nr:nuclear transport factor 2 family protein [Acidimicrobiales bacterium]
MTEQAIQQLADEMEIRNLVAHLAHLADMAKDLDEYLECFTEDAVWEFPGDGEGLAHSQNMGRDAIKADRFERRNDRFQGPGTNTRHVNTTLSVRVLSDETAEAESYWLFVTDTTGQPQVRSMGHYFDRFRRTDDGWKFASRQITTG